MAESEGSEFVVVDNESGDAKAEKEDNQDGDADESKKEESSDDIKAKSFEEKVAEEMDKAKDMKISEMKLKLQSKGILTSTFCEKSEFIRAYAEAVVKEAENGGEGGGSSAMPVFARTKFSGDDSSDAGPLEEIPLYVQHRLEKLLGFDEEREKIMKDYLEERAKLEAKYHALVKPLYQKRREVVSGEKDDEIEKENEGQNEETSATPGEKQKGIPQFWVCALGHMDVIAEMLTEQDVGVLNHLEDIRCEDDENGQGFTLSFHFSPNEYFENNILTKRYEVPNLLLADEPILQNVYGCEILWKPGKCLTFKTVEKQQRGTGKNAGQVRTIKKKVKSESFFHFFTPPQMPSMDDMDEEQAEQLESAFNDDYDIAQAFRSHVVPKAVQWFTGMAMEQGMEEAMQGMAWPEQGAPSDGENPECKPS